MYHNLVHFVRAIVLLGAFMIRSQAQTPEVAAGGVVGANAFGGFSSIAPGSWIEIYGTNLAVDTRGWATSDFQGGDAPTSLDGTSVTIGGQSAFVDYISPGQVNAQVPSNAPTGAQPVVVAVGSVVSAPYTVNVNAVEPGLLAPASFKILGTQYAVALFSDGAYALPPGAINGVDSRRAQPGDVITLYGVGFGPVVPNTPAGQVVQQNNALSTSFTLQFGTTAAALVYDGLAPGEVGLYQFNAVVPNVTSSDTVPLMFRLGGTAGTQVLYIPVENRTVATGSGSSLPPFTDLDGTVTYQPVGYPAGGDEFNLLPNAGNTTYTLTYSGLRFVNGTASGPTFTFNNLGNAPAGFVLGATVLEVSSASLTLTFAPSSDTATLFGTVTGTLTLTGTPVSGGASVTVTGNITGQFINI